MLKFALIALLTYLLLRAVANLLQAMFRQGRVGPGAQRPRFGGGGSNEGRRRSHSQRGSDDSDRATRLRDEEDVEDARWEDL